eukprot:TRINITY_DN26608_c0_g1_i1.p1 TRINITY_DN26608_c0_g1~~TRINITY_DN26608_c0_g1_i1.p1  ORF type:complete len:398 (-),score=32.27 TRINITY_DN26608_c0_g1_i1:123-1316(-)
MLGPSSERQQHQHLCNLKRCGHTADRPSSRGRTRRQLASEGIAKGCLRPTDVFSRAESPLVQARAADRFAPLTRGRELGATVQRRGPSASVSHSPMGIRPRKTQCCSPHKCFGTPPMLDPDFVGQGADSDCSGANESELVVGETAAAYAGCRSPTDNELTDAALFKSQELLRQFSSLNLDVDSDATPNRGCEDSMSEISFRSLSPKTFVSARCSSPKDDDDGTVKVPKEFMKMMGEMWDEIRVLRAAQKPEDLTSLQRSKTEPSKSGACSVMSFTSTASTRSGSFSSRSSPRREAYFPAPVPPPSTPRYMISAASPRPATTASTSVATPQRCASTVRPCAAASYCVPASSAIHVCVPPIAPHTRMSVPHVRAASQTPPCRSISMVQTVTVTTSWMVS